MDALNPLYCPPRPTLSSPMGFGALALPTFIDDDVV